MTNLLSKSSIGIDIADNSIEVVQLKKIGASIDVKSLGRVNLPSGVVKNGRIIKEAELAKALSAALNQAQPKPITDNKVIFGFPESQTFFHIFSYQYQEGEKNIDKEKMDRVILEEAWSNIPIVKNEMVVYYQILAEKKDRVDFLIVAAMKRIVFEWQEFFNKLDLDVQTFDIEALANFRSLAVESKKPICIIDMGAVTTNLYVFVNKKIVYEYTINIAGEDLTAEVAKAAKISEEEAEKKKIEVGLSNTEEIFFSALVKVLGSISDEIKEALNYFETSSKTKIEQLIFVGGSSQLKGLMEYFNANLNLPVALGTSKYLDGKKLEFIGAIGMSLRGLDKKDDEEDPVIPFVEEGSWETKNESQKESDKIKTAGNEDEKAAPDNGDVKRKSRGKILLLILFIGIILFGAAFYYRQQQELKQQEAIKASLEKVNNLEVVQEPDLLATSTIEQAASTSSDAVATTSAGDIKEDNVERVVVTETEVGYLNVRKGAGKNFDIITKVMPGETYELIEKQGEWSKIKLSAETDGWVASKYLQEKN